DARKRAYCLKIQPATGVFARNLIYSTKPTVTLDCGGEEKMAKEELYDAAVKAAIKYGYE
ncbi:TPA: hypothetical protein ACPUTY_005665, partial [Klebsiella pneumoniae]